MMKAAFVVGIVAAVAFGYIACVWIFQRVIARRKRATRRQRYQAGTQHSPTPVGLDSSTLAAARNALNVSGAILSRVQNGS